VIGCWLSAEEVKKKMSNSPRFSESSEKRNRANYKFLAFLIVASLMLSICMHAPEVTAQSPVMLGIEGRACYPDGSCLMFYTWDGERMDTFTWYPSSGDVTREFDLSEWLPDIDGEYKIWIWAQTWPNGYDTFEMDRIYLQIGDDVYAPTSATNGDPGEILWCVKYSDDNDWWLDPDSSAYCMHIKFKVDVDGPVTSTVAASPNPASVNGPISITATVDDSMTGGAPIVSAKYWLDAVFTSPLPMGAQDGAFDQVTEAVNATIPADTLSPGVYTIYVRGTDSRGNVGVEAEAVIPLVVYDPTDGFVTGGGWIDSPPGAYYEEGLPTDLAGKASFGFVSKYKKGASTPSGQTEFVFKTADLNFHSDSYEWLVIAGPRAMFKGTGTINGAGEYGFMLSAIDGEVNGGGGIDRFRIKIWAIGGDIVYDNQPGDKDDAELTTELGGGRIVIHKA